MEENRYKRMGIKQKAAIIESTLAAEEKVRRDYGVPVFPKCPICNGFMTNPLLVNVCQWCGSDLAAPFKIIAEGVR